MPVKSFARLLLVVITHALLCVQVGAILMDVDNPRAYAFFTTLLPKWTDS
jgi:hypothetical protein